MAVRQANANSKQCPINRTVKKERWKNFYKPLLSVFKRPVFNERSDFPLVPKEVYMLSLIKTKIVEKIHFTKKNDMH